VQVTRLACGGFILSDACGRKLQHTMADVQGLVLLATRIEWEERKEDRGRAAGNQRKNNEIEEQTEKRGDKLFE
jgi:hypothetical protein